MSTDKHPAPQVSWISVLDELPPDEQFVLLCCDAGMTDGRPNIFVGRRYEAYRPRIDGKIRWLDVNNNTADILGPLWWSPLPNLPTPRNLFRDSRIGGRATASSRYANGFRYHECGRQQGGAVLKNLKTIGSPWEVVFDAESMEVEFCPFCGMKLP